MYKCNECGSEFLEPRIIQDKVPYGEGKVMYPAYACCPRCGGNFEEANNICELCGDSFSESIHDDVCPSCINIIAKRFSDMLKANFEPFEISILNAAYDGRNLE